MFTAKKKTRWASRPVASYITQYTPLLASTRYAQNMRKSGAQVVLSSMQLSLHATRRTLHGASRSRRLATWSVKTRRAPSPHGMDASEGHWSSDRGCAAMHEMRAHPSPSPLSSAFYRTLLPISEPTFLPTSGALATEMDAPLCKRFLWRYFPQ